MTIKSEQSRPSIHIISIGNELLNGQTLDTNSHFLIRELTNLGFKVGAAEVLPDESLVIKSSLNRQLNKTDDFSRIPSKLPSELPEVVIITGGLGPTSDDITRFVLGEAFSLELVEDASSKKKLEEHAKRRGRVLTKTNLRQAFFPEGADIIENEWGTANCFSVEVSQQQQGSDKKTKFICLPGVPSEMKSIFYNKLVPVFKESYLNLSEKQFAFLRCFGLPESEIGQKIESLNLSDDIEIAYRPKFPEILICLSSKNNDLTDTRFLESKTKIINELGKEHVYSDNFKDSPQNVLFNLASSKNKTISLAESCTGGLIASKIVSIPGSSKIFLGSAVTYSNELKKSLLGVSEDTLKNFGAVSEQTAIEMAEGIRKKTSSDYALSVTGIAGPDGGTKEKPAGTFFVGLASSSGTTATKSFFSFEREQFREIVSAYAIDLLRKELL